MALAALTVEQRETIKTMRLAGASVRKIAGVLKLSYTSVRSSVEASAPRIVIPEPAAPRIDTDLVKDLALRSALETPVASLGLTLRSINLLETVGIVFVSDLLRWTEAELRAIPNVNDTTMTRIFAGLEKLGLHRKQGQEKANAC